MLYITQMYLVSAIIWIPFSLFQWYFAWKHFSASKWFQFGIVLCFSAGATLRCIWLFAHAIEKSNVSLIYGWMLINRTAVLLQFTGLTLLMGLWSRSLILTKYMEKKLSVVDGPTFTPDKLGVQKKRVLFSGDVLEDAIGKVSVKSRRVKYMFINTFAWSVTYATTGNKDLFWSLVNGFMLASLSVIVAAGLTYIGLKSWYQLKYSENLSLQVANRTESTEQQRPVSLQAPGSTASTEVDDKKSTIRPASTGSTTTTKRVVSKQKNKESNWLVVQIYRFLYQRDLTRVDVRTEVVRTILQVMVVVNIFFFIRFFAYLYRNIVMREHLIPELGFQNDTMVCSIFLYQVPEFFPNMSIIIALSPSMFKKHPFLAYLCSCGVWVRSYERNTQADVPIYQMSTRILESINFDPDCRDSALSEDPYPEKISALVADESTISPMANTDGVTTL